MAIKKKASFSVGQDIISSHLYYPDNWVADNTGLPAILLCHGFAGVKELLLPAYAEAFAQAGFLAMTFDYRGFGESEGEKGRLVPALQIEDIHMALASLAHHPDVDAERIGLWGTSYGGANAIVVAANSPKVKCLSVQLTFGSGRRVVTSAMTDDEETKFNDMINKMLKKKEATGKEMMTPLGKVLSDPQSAAFYQQYAPLHDALTIKIPFLTVHETMQHTPEDHMAAVAIPTLIVGAENDGVNPVEESHRLFDKAACIKDLLIIEGAEHYDCYTGKPFNSIVDKQTEWFQQHM